MEAQDGVVKRSDCILATSYNDVVRRVHVVGTIDVESFTVTEGCLQSFKDCTCSVKCR